jgi:hypothetical protein
MNVFLKFLMMLAMFALLLGACEEEDSNCTDGKYDPVSGLCWQDPSSLETMNWYVATGIYDATQNPETDDYCFSLGSGWRLPTISELRSLVRECIWIEWEMDWTEAPEGYCEVWDSCLSSSCRESILCYPSGCSESQAPGTGGCYWDAALSGTCDAFWSSSEVEGSISSAWEVIFDSANVIDVDKNSEKYVRCVRTEP